ncbi:fibronectin type III domain-containing protein [Haloplanus litoreus]|uniref:Fibronectin type-III domain-containing protein n=1 Tax=Haloplanus litoreus TaxID=767515 RepID=A0ABD5ZT96_9EURY
MSGVVPVVPLRSSNGTETECTSPSRKVVVAVPVRTTLPTTEITAAAVAPVEDRRTGAQDGGGSGEGGDGGTQENLDADPDIPATAGHPGGTTAIAELTSVTETTESPATPRIEIIDHPRNVSLTVADHTDTTVDLAVDADNSESWTIHRSTSSGFSPDSGNQVASISSGGAQTYTDTGLTQGKIYYYKAVATNPAGSTATSEVSQTTNGPAPTFGSLTVVDDSGDGHADAFDCDFTRGGSDEDHLEIRGSIDNGSSFSQLGTDQTPDTTQYTTPEQDDGQEYVLKVTAVYPDTESDSGTLTRTTDPRDLSQDDITPVDTSVEDQLRIPNPGVADYGDYRGQLRVTNSGDAYGSDVVVAYDGADLVFTGLPDGEKFDLQGRHETEHVNGVWAGVSAITLLPQPGDVQVASIQATQATITWDDTADNEDDILIERRREYADGFGAYEEVVVKAANATQHVDDTIVPGVTYQWRVSNRTEHVVSRATTAQATSNSIRPSNAAPIWVVGRSRHTQCRYTAHTAYRRLPPARPQRQRPRTGHDPSPERRGLGLRCLHRRPRSGVARWQAPPHRPTR